MSEPLRTADGHEVKEGLYLQEGRNLFKVSTAVGSEVSLQVCLEAGELPATTRVMNYARVRAQHLRTANPGMVQRYHDLLDIAASRPAGLSPHDFEQREGIGGCGVPQCGLSRHNPVHAGEGPL